MKNSSDFYTGVCKIMITFADRFRGRGLIRRKGTGQQERYGTGGKNGTERGRDNRRGCG